MARYYFYTADMFYEDKETPGAEVRHVGDYQGVYAVDDDTLTPDAIFANVMEEFKNTIPARSKRQCLLSHHAVQQRHITRSLALSRQPGLSPMLIIGKVCGL
jgi:hypothetical protein